MKKYILSVLVQNNPGVLARISSLFARRGYNIDSLTVSSTKNMKISKITMIVMGDDEIVEKVFKQVSKLEETISVTQIKRNPLYMLWTHFKFWKCATQVSPH